MTDQHTRGPKTVYPGKSEYLPLRITPIASAILNHACAQKGWSRADVVEELIRTYLQEETT